MNLPGLNKESVAVPVPRIGVFVPGDGLGDGIMRIPLLHAIQRRWPDHRVWWVAAGPTALSTALQSYTAGNIERIDIGFSVEASLGEIRRKAAQLPHFDVIFNFYSRIASVLFARLLLKPREHYACLTLQLGSSRRDSRWILRRPAHKLHRLRSIAAAAGCVLRPARESFPISRQAMAAAARLIRADGKAVGFAVGRGNLTIEKEWPLDRFLATARLLMERGRAPVFLVGPAERPLVERMRSNLPGAIIAELDRPDPDTGAQGIDLCLAIGARLGAAITNDAGLAHVLAVADVPLVALFGPTNPRRWAPEVELIQILRAQDFGSEQMEAIPVDAVTRAFEALTKGLRKRPGTDSGTGAAPMARSMSAS
jgi:ADP-heptose:LPS heptosyltransferase